MPENTREFEWTPEREMAAQLLAEDDLTDEQIAEQIGYEASSLYRWKRIPEFYARIEEIRRKIGLRLERYAIARKPQRVARLQKRWDKLHRVIEARAEEHANIPGGDTGLLVHQQKALGAGENFQVVDEYVVDVAVLKEAREMEKQAAQEAGQWTERTETDLTSGGKRLVPAFIEISDDAEAKDADQSAG